MAVVKRMSSKAKVGKIEKYLKQESKTEEKLISGMNCDSDNFAKQCEMTNLLYRKNDNKNDRKYYHIVQSFSPKDNDKITYEQAHKIAMKFAEKNFKGHEVLVITHKDKEHVHNHFVVNSVNLENGKKYRADNKSLWQLRRTSNELCKEQELTHSIQPLDKKANNKIKSGELRKALRGEEVWKIDLRAQIETVSQKVKSFDEFKKEMADKYKVEVRERTRKSKGEIQTIYEYKPNENRKFCPENRLGKDYGKENIDGFIRRNEEKSRNQSKGIDGRNAGQSNGINTGKLESEIRNRQVEQIHNNAESRKLDIKQREQELTRIQEKDRGNQKSESKTHERTKSSQERSR